MLKVWILFRSSNNSSSDSPFPFHVCVYIYERIIMCDKSIIQFHLDRFLHRFYYILSKFYLTSYSGGSIFDHYCKFLLLDSTECLLINSLPVKEKFQFFLSFIVVFYYVAIIFDLINYYPDIIRFIAGDLALFFSDQTSTIPKILCIMLAFTIASESIK